MPFALSCPASYPLLCLFLHCLCSSDVNPSHLPSQVIEFASAAMATTANLLYELPKVRLNCPDTCHARNPRDSLNYQNKQELLKSRTEAAMPVDDALYVELDEKYVGLLFYDHEDAKATYRIDSVTYVDNKKKKGLPPAWQAECVEVFRQPDGKWCPAKADVVVEL